MRTTFGGFTIATSGLYAAQRSLDVTGHNISNSNTTGYSRQVSRQRATLPMTGDPTGVIGTGVETYAVDRIRSDYLDNKYWSQNKNNAEWNVKENELAGVEVAFNEPSDTSVRQVMDDLYTSLEELSKKPGDSTNRVNVLEKANTVTIVMNSIGTQLVDEVRELNFAVKNKVGEINSLTGRIASLNKSIFNYELDGTKANDLRDQRSNLVDELSTIIPISVSEIPGTNGNNYYDIKTGGISLVEHTQARQLDVEQNPVSKTTGDGLSDLGAGNIATVIWKDTTGTPLSIEGGELKGLIDMRDGDGSNQTYRGIPYYINKLNQFAKEYSAKFNEVHKQGFDTKGVQGIDFFNVPTDSTNVNFKNFKVNQKLLDDPNLLAASNTANGTNNNENVTKLIAIRNAKDIFSSVTGTGDDYLKSVLSSLSVDSNQAKRMNKNSEALLGQTKLRRMSESGVSLDEEMTNLVTYQQAYQAAARNITTFDKILDTTINRMGLVGR